MQHGPRDKFRIGNDEVSTSVGMPSLNYNTCQIFSKDLLQAVGKPTQLMKRFASTGGSVSPVTLCTKTYASIEVKVRDPKIRIIKVFPKKETFRD